MDCLSMFFCESQLLTDMKKRKGTMQREIILFIMTCDNAICVKYYP